jgi:hypothetical protein
MRKEKKWRAQDVMLCINLCLKRQKLVSTHRTWNYSCDSDGPVAGFRLHLLFLSQADLCEKKNSGVSRCDVQSMIPQPVLHDESTKACLYQASNLRSCDSEGPSASEIQIFTKYMVAKVIRGRRDWGHEFFNNSRQYSILLTKT